MNVTKLDIIFYLWNFMVYLVDFGLFTKNISYKADEITIKKEVL